MTPTDRTELTREELDLIAWRFLRSEFTEQIYAQFITRFNWPQGSAFGFLLLALSSAIVWAGLKLSGQSLGRTLRQG